MSKLVIVTSTVQALLGDATADFACTPTDALHFGHRIGEVVLIATVTSTGAQYEAVGTLAGFQNDAAGRTRVHLEQINSLLSPVPVFAELPSRQAIFEIDNEIFEGVIAQGTGDAQFDEETTIFRGFSSSDILDQLASQSRRRCVFSDVITYKGVATIIRRSAKAAALMSAISCSSTGSPANSSRANAGPSAQASALFSTPSPLAPT